ncbi:LysR family transcriptional regulator [Kineosporia rhizophila]|uniref:LysR family transcriptional regulator n=1 Tax=Kineosporia TaxID=49184 RepID=UPI001E3C7763|nr:MULTISPECIES: LysR family transcriptional regulator [Kineosporia]MCE0537309.1 LysR family transcriptional regulator [Kineosporia rhizophila]GLY17547.1 LysR family transcriptional regulator [Kineosporia sp. NBRC 101677]
MDDRDLRWLTLLAETENVSQTAAQLGVPQPTVSRALARLEADFGAPLFDRAGGRLRLNRSGELAVAHAQRVVQEIDTARERIAELNHPERGLIRLGFLSTLGESVVPALLTRYRRSAPEVRFVLQEGHSTDFREWIREGRVDLALTGRMRPGTDPDWKDVGWAQIQTQQLCLAVPAGHPLAGGGPVDLAQVAHEQFITFWPRAEVRLLTEQLCREAGFTPAVAVQTGEVATARALVAAGLGVAVVPAPGIPAGPVTASSSSEVLGVVHLPLSNPGAERQVGIAWPAHGRLSPAVARFLAFLRSGGE